MSKNAGAPAIRYVMVRVSELSGAQLDWAVGRALGGAMGIRKEKGIAWCIRSQYDAIMPFNPSGNWRDGGRVIEHANIGVWPAGEGNWSAVSDAEAPNDDYYEAYGHRQQFGETPLVAAMRCLVGTHYGAEVGVPAIGSDE